MLPVGLRDFSQSNKHEDSHKESPWFPCIPTLIPHIPRIPNIPTPIPHIPTLIPRVPTVIPHVPTLIPRVHTLILLILFPDSPFRILQIVSFILKCWYSMMDARENASSIIQHVKKLRKCWMNVWTDLNFHPTFLRNIGHWSNIVCKGIQHFLSNKLDDVGSTCWTRFPWSLEKYQNQPFIGVNIQRCFEYMQ